MFSLPDIARMNEEVVKRQAEYDAVLANPVETICCICDKRGIHHEKLPIRSIYTDKVHDVLSFCSRHEGYWDDVEIFHCWYCGNYFNKRHSWEKCYTYTHEQNVVCLPCGLGIWLRRGCIVFTGHQLKEIGIDERLPFVYDMRDKKQALYIEHTEIPKDIEIGINVLKAPHLFTTLLQTPNNIIRYKNWDFKKVGGMSLSGAWQAWVLEVLNTFELCERRFFFCIDGDYQFSVSVGLYGFLSEGWKRE